MLLSRSLRLCRFLLPRRSSLLLLILLAGLFLILSLTGQLEESLSRLLPLFYSSPSHPNSYSFFRHGLPSFLISPSNACSQAPFLLILVSSAPSHRDRRDAIRQTWGSPSTSAASNSLTLFVLAISNSEKENEAVVHEAELHRDIVQVAFADTYRNLTLKTLAGLAWGLQKCQSARFILKTDDDVFVNTPSLSKFLSGQDGLQYLGRIHWHVGPIRDPESRHYTSRDVYPGGYFPPYCSGTGYVLSRGAAVLMLQKLKRGPLLSLEDVYVGILAQAAGVAPRHIAKIAGSRALPHKGCCYRTMFTSHGVPPKRMVEAWIMREMAEEAWCPLAMVQCLAFGKLVENWGFGVL
ncbi:beta-1,3-galactosyltransferase 4 [Spea bombifrons]|uniref:beta-1,3-galactosyltransferase 4 n=1 Tax=Spea bombifrons TaxID=233779 RepID=UPI00234B0225|nr:beta-1,3-galactosyltransferase 4 [Spea bombifrons]